MKKPAAKARPKPRPKAKAASEGASTGAAESAAWVAARGLSTAGKARWSAKISLDVVDAPASEVYTGTTATRFQLELYRDEWGFKFVYKGKTSHLRKTGEVFVNGHDEHKLVKQMPALAELGAFVRALETRHGIAFQRPHAHIRSNLAGAQAALREWLATL